MMRKLTLSAVVGAVLIAGLVRVQLVAVAQDAAPGGQEGVGAAPAPEAKAPSGPPTKVQREQLTYDGKRFADYELILAAELAPDRRAEAITAMTAFASAGYGKEVADVIFAEMASFDQRRYADERGKTLRAACRSGLREIDPAIVTPLLIEAISPTDSEHVGPLAAIPPEQSIARRMALQSITSQNKSDELVKGVVEIIRYEHAPEQDRVDAMQALLRLTDRFEGHWDVMRELVLNSNTPEQLKGMVRESIYSKAGDSEEFLESYTRELVSPVMLHILDAVEATGNPAGWLREQKTIAPLLRRDSAALMPRLLAWYEDEQQQEAVAGFFLADLTWSTEQLAALAKAEKSEDEQIQVLRLMRYVVEASRLIGRPRQEEARQHALVATLIESIALSIDDSRRTVAEEGVEAISLLALHSNSPEIQAAARKELEKHQVKMDEEWEFRYRRRVNRGAGGF